MDFFTVGCTVLVFVALIGVVATSYLSATGRDGAAERLDLAGRVALPTSYALLLGWFLRGLL